MKWRSNEVVHKRFGARCRCPWHGAAPNTAMTHITIQEQLDGKTVDWICKTNPTDYNDIFTGGW